MDGYRVMPMEQAAPQGHFFVTVTGNRDAISADHFRLMRDGAIICNAGHFDVEIAIPALAAMARERRTVRPNVEEFVLEDGRRIRLLAEGRLVNLGAAEGHPAQVMDMSFANQALSAAWLVQQQGRLERKVYTVPEDIDREVARRKLASMGIELQSLTPEQEEYLHSWQFGT